jgi:hypothetical protein
MARADIAPDCNEAKEWLGGLRCDNRAPSWELCRDDGVIFLTSAGQSLVDDVSSWAKGSVEAGSFAIVKTVGGCGATSMARAVAWQLPIACESVFVAWLTRAVEEDVASTLWSQLVVHAQSTGKSRVVVVCDEGVGGVEHLERTAPPAGAVVYVREGFTSARSSDFSCSPLLEPRDFRRLVVKLKRLYPESEAALDCALAAAEQSAVMSHDRHIFVFGLAATNGMYEPAEKWISRLVDVLKSGPDVVCDIVRAGAWAGAFRTSSNGSQPAYNVDIALDECARAHNGKCCASCAAAEVLFGWAVDGRAIHPLFSRLVLLKMDGIAWAHSGAVDQVVRE